MATGAIGLMPCEDPPKSETVDKRAMRLYSVNISERSHRADGTSET